MVERERAKPISAGVTLLFVKRVYVPLWGWRSAAPIRMPGRETSKVPALLGAGGLVKSCFVAPSGHGGNPREVPAARCPTGDAPRRADHDI